MPDDDLTFDEFLRAVNANVAAMMRTAFDMGKAAGAEEARKRVLAAFGAGDPLVNREANAQSSSTAPSAGAVSEPIRKAMAAMDIGPEGVSPQEVADFINRSDEARLDMSQVRAGLKNLYRQKELERVRRGRYRRAGAEPVSVENAVPLAEPSRASQTRGTGEPAIYGKLFETTALSRLPSHVTGSAAAA